MESGQIQKGALFVVRPSHIFINKNFDYGISFSFSQLYFCRLQGMSVRVTRLSNRSIDFDLAGVDASIANAFRRILIAEVSGH
jgi:hypothetical protein